MREQKLQRYNGLPKTNVNILIFALHGKALQKATTGVSVNHGARIFSFRENVTFIYASR